MHVHTCMNKQGAVCISFSHCHHRKGKKKCQRRPEPSLHLLVSMCYFQGENFYIATPFEGKPVEPPPPVPDATPPRAHP